MSGEHPAGLVGYFGFGSLVNRDTLKTSYVSHVPATLKGWRRHWQAKENDIGRNVALLSVHRDSTSFIKGALIVDRAENLPAIDERESGYTRVELKPVDLEIPADFSLPERLYVYVANGSDFPAGLPLLQSYLDAVLQGFHLLYGAEGISHFIETTDSFSRSIVPDRERPIYPRSVALTLEQRLLIDQALRPFSVADLGTHQTQISRD